MNTFTDTGCIKLNGTTCSLPGQYKLRVYITANVGVPIYTNADAAGFKFFVRVKNLSSPDIPVDTSQTSANPFISYGDSIWGCAYDTLCHAAFTLYPDTTSPHKWWALNQATSIMPLTYFWTWGDGTGTFGPTPSHDFTSAGNYNICLNISNPWGCSNTFCDSSTYIYKTDAMIAVQVVNHLPTDILQLPPATTQFSLSPNPATSQLTINSSVPIERINIYNTTGQLVLQTKQTAIDVSGLGKGVYVAEVTPKSPKGDLNTAPVMRRWVKM